MTTSGNVVTVACKIPAGIFMQGYKMESAQEPILGGGYRETKIAVPVGEKIKINGPAAPQGAVAHNLVDGGYVLTPNVDAETAKAWMEANKASPMVKNKLIFISDKRESAEAQAKNNRSARSGLERLNVGTISKEGREVPADPRWPRSNNVNVTAVTTADRT